MNKYTCIRHPISLTWLVCRGSIVCPRHWGRRLWRRHPAASARSPAPPNKATGELPAIPAPETPSRSAHPKEKKIRNIIKIWRIQSTSIYLRVLEQTIKTKTQWLNLRKSVNRCHHCAILARHWQHRCERQHVCWGDECHGAEVRFRWPVFSRNAARHRQVVERTGALQPGALDAAHGAHHSAPEQLHRRPPERVDVRRRRTGQRARQRLLRLVPAGRRTRHRRPVSRRLLGPRAFGYEHKEDQ